MSESWRYLRIGEYEPPRERAKSLRLGLRRLWRRRFAGLLGSMDEALESSPGDRLSEASMTDLVPSLDVEAAASGLLRALDPWPDREASRAVWAVVGPPGSHHPEVLRHLANERGWTVVEPPSRAELWGQGDALDRSMEQLSQGLETPLVIPELDRWLLRYEPCLPVLRGAFASGFCRGSPSCGY